MINEEINKKYETYILNIVLFHTIPKCHGHFHRQLINSLLITPKVALKTFACTGKDTKNVGL